MELVRIKFKLVGSDWQDGWLLDTTAFEEGKPCGWLVPAHYQILVINNDGEVYSRKNTDIKIKIVVPSLDDIKLGL